MAGRIRASDIEEVKRRTNLADLVGDYVALKNAGADSMKGLCPFHDERSPSFHVRPALGYYHCFGCGESGDAFTFLQRMDHLTFSESVERLAARANVVLTYEEGGTGRREEGPNRARLLAANQAAAAFYVAQLGSEEGGFARRFLTDRGFDGEACATFGVGYAPRGWDGLTNHLTGQGYTRDELLQAGLVSSGNRGVYDRFRGRIVWPIRDTSGQTLGFGARKLYDDDNGPKYLNTPETPVYHKARVLYGIDQAKRAIARGHRAVVVEGYTDVMACHLSGVDTAIATCGTAFGADHITMLRRMMGDDSAAEVIFTFDPDEAGQKAALRAFSEEKRFSGQTYIAVAPDGLDPSDLRLHRGDEALRELFTRKQPLFEFALRQAVGRFDLNSVAGRVAALREAAPIVANIKDPSMRPGYARELARMIGVDLGEAQAAVRSAAQAGARADTERVPPPQADPGAAPQAPRIGLATLQSSPRTWLERDALQAMIQHRDSVGDDLMSQAVTAQVTEPNLRVVRDGIAAALGDEAGEVRDGWIDRIAGQVPERFRGLVRELAVAPIPSKDPKRVAAYSRDVVISLLDRDLVSLKAELVARMQRIGDSADEGSRRIQQQLVALEMARRGLRDAEQ
ncbi:DNA primase [Leucobacter sp. Psy1]|uniref:DNA primase n=1 Tax=Leucobacter sp. Psy1 TaxID=2875729 RepID=UPI001CD39A81|nr:DNA primase [Leucobacter sp. Psy1]UBH06172.1 DNA primase [Leucobacter sp. Psy1]